MTHDRNSHPRPGRFDTPNLSWRWWGCVTVLVLLASTFVQREYQLFTQAQEAPSPVAPDFGVYYVVGLITRSGHKGQLYSTPLAPTKAEQARKVVLGDVPADTELARVAAQTTHTRITYYTYPPFFAWAFGPITYLKPRVAYFAWRMLSTLMLVLAIYLVVVSIQAEAGAGIFVVAAVGALSFFPFSEVLFEAQVGCLVLFLWSLGFYFIQARRTELSAVTFAGGSLIKITPGIVVSVMLLRRQWRWLVSYCLAGALLVLITLPRVGWNAYWTYTTKVFPLLSAGIEGYPLKSIGSVLRNLYLGRGIVTLTDPWQVPIVLRVLISLANFGLLAIVLFYLLKNRNSSPRVLAQEFAILALVSLMISPVTWRHHYVIAILPLLCAWMHSRESASPRRLALLSAITLVLGTPYIDFVLVRLQPGRLQAILSSAFLVASGFLLWLCMQDHRRMSEPVAQPASEQALAT
jgi:glycosyl transferase family 87